MEEAGEQNFVTTLDKEILPNNFKEAILDPNWKKAIKEELSALHKNKSWVISQLLSGKKTVGCKWVFTKKYNPDGSINKYKAKLVAKGYSQTYGIDYQEIFTPVKKLNTIRIQWSLATNLDWPLHQRDFKNAFLNRDLENEVHMEIHKG
ncbi:uncharacterized protein LOC114712689 [Neltuma alba]|uniref:uncharacterized protein LOC114712689 n=1 Tax=Neltuma alba TaxID=207710 RepID=UPI0010A45E10|nr:uncharacterized protein LOC114712689 [Prosopis alba]